MMRGYRDDDRRDCGYCPHCGKPLTGVTRAALGYCEQHGWVWSEWNTTKQGDSMFYIVTISDDEPELIGPFTDGTEAVDFASEHLDMEAWWVVDAAQATSPTSSAFAKADA